MNETNKFFWSNELRNLFNESRVTAKGQKDKQEELTACLELLTYFLRMNLVVCVFVFFLLHTYYSTRS